MSTMSTMPPLERRLPQELERVIFEIASRHRRSDILRFALVACRVRAWVEPILYEALLLYTGSQRTFRSDIRACTNPQDLATMSHRMAHVRHLLFHVSDHSELAGTNFVLQCHNLQYYSTWSTYQPKTMLQDLVSIIRSPMRTVSPKGLLRLSAKLTDIFQGQAIDFNHEVLKDITHLDVMDSESELGPWEEGNNFGCLKNLRCLSFYQHGSDSFEILKTCLEECKSLEMVVIFRDYSSSRDYTVVELLQGAKRRVKVDGILQEVSEDRVILLHSPDDWIEAWMNEAAGDEDVWTRGEQIIQRRRDRLRNRGSDVR